MKKTSNLILIFLLGFYGYALFIDDNLEMLKCKSIVFTVGVVVALILELINDIGYKKRSKKSKYSRYTKNILSN